MDICFAMAQALVALSSLSCLLCSEQNAVPLIQHISHFRIRIIGSSKEPQRFPKWASTLLLAYRIFSVIQILLGTTILRLLPVVLLAPVLDGHSLLCENREQPEESLTLMLQDQTRFTGRQRQTNLPLSDTYA
nr:MAG TPA: hypothetical protein [Caudoviricetes sp.]